MRKLEIRQGGKLPAGQYEVEQHRQRHIGRGLHPPAAAQQIQRDAEENVGDAAIRDEEPDGERRVSQRRQDGIPQPGPGSPVGRVVQDDEQEGPGQRQHHGRQTAQDAALPQPVDALPDGDEEGVIHADRIYGEEPVGAHAGLGVHHQEQQQAHPGGNGPDAPKVPPPVMGVGEALHRAEQEQRRRQPSQHGEPFRDQAGEAEKVVDVVHYHQHQGQHFEGGVAQACLGASGAGQGSGRNVRH